MIMNYKTYRKPEDIWLTNQISFPEVLCYLDIRTLNPFALFPSHKTMPASMQPVARQTIACNFNSLNEEVCLHSIYTVKREREKLF